MYILYLISFQVIRQKQISQKLQNWEVHGTILKRLVMKPRSRGQALGGGPGAKLPEAPRFKPY